jgi:integrase
MTQQAFWAWPPETWVSEILAESQQAFQQAYPAWVDGAVRPYLVGIAYVLTCFAAFHLIGGFNRIALANRVFGPTLVQQAVDPILRTLRDWGYHSARHTEKFPGLVSALLLYNRSPYLADLTASAIDHFRSHGVARLYQGAPFYGVHLAMAALGFVDPPVRSNGLPPTKVEGVDPLWQEWVERWTDTSTLTRKVRLTFRNILFKVGRWLAHQHPEVREPGQWNRELCAAYLAQVERMRVGDYVQRRDAFGGRFGRPLSARTKAGYIVAVRTFFHDCQEWEWIPGRFDPVRAFATPRTIRALIGPNPRVIADDIWAKLLWAGLNLETGDLPASVAGQFYPVQLVRALSLVWLFAGLRSDEIFRLRLGCIRWQNHAGGRDESQTTVDPDVVCLLDVPTHKTGSAFTKPVDPLVGHAIAEWEAIRPEQPSLLDRRTSEHVHFLFCYRARRLPKEYLNRGLIPILCRKAGVPLQDARGRITSHRARATIASQLYNAKEPMTLFELQAWLGHRSAETTQYYARITPTTLAKAYTDAGYFARNMRTIEVLIDREAVEQGAAANGTPWQYFDLGHAYCTYSFFEQCPHRMACARCDFYLPKGSTQSQLLEAKDHLQQMLAAIPLTEEEQAAVEDGQEALDRLLERLVDVPTPTGQTPQQLVQELSNSDSNA